VLVGSPVRLGLITITNMENMWSMFATPDDEEVEGPSAASSEAEKITAKLNAPPAGRVAPGFVGLMNQGATCYMNSLLQAHFMTPEFRNFIFSFDPEEDLGVGHCTWVTRSDADALKAFQDAKNAKRAKAARLLPLQLQRLFAELYGLDVECRSTSNLTEIGFQWSGNDGRVQHDVQDLNRNMMEWVHKSVGEVCTERTGKAADMFRCAAGPWHGGAADKLMVVWGAVSHRRHGQGWWRMLCKCSVGRAYASDCVGQTVDAVLPLR
jgi:hypothetical protein